MTSRKQLTLAAQYTFEGKGLHTGTVSRMTIKPSAENTGIVFHRTDLGEDAFVEALASNITCTARSTTIAKGEVSVSTIEHLMSALTGLGVDNALVEIDNVEVPILDGSARYYVEAICKDGLKEQEAERKYIEITEEIEVKDEKSGAWVKISPADETEYDITVDFNSRVLGVQSAHWDPSMDYAKEIGPCRTFVFFHEIAFLFQNNLIKGGDVDNAIVIVEHPAPAEQLEQLKSLFNIPDIYVREDGYLSNLQLHFPNECGRHKLLDLIGDLRLAGGFLKAKVTAFKPGHTINSLASRAVLEQLKNR